MAYAKAFMVKVLEEGISDPESFANKLTDKRYAEFARTYNFAAGGVDTNLINIPFDKLQIRSGGYGILDVIFLPGTKLGWAVGGGGTIFGSKDGGATWQKDKSADDLPTNLYKIKFFGDTGYILGSNGVLLRLA